MEYVLSGESVELFEAERLSLIVSVSMFQSSFPVLPEKTYPSKFSLTA